MSTMGRSHRSHYSQSYYNDRPYYIDRPVYPTMDRSMAMYSPDRPGLYSSDRQLYYSNGMNGPPPPPTEHSQVIVEHKRPKFGPCTWIGICVFIIFVIVVIICLIIFFTWGKTYQTVSKEVAS